MNRRMSQERPGANLAVGFVGESVVESVYSLKGPESTELGGMD